MTAKLVQSPGKPRIIPPSIRTGSRNQRPWVKASGSLKSRLEMARFYLKEEFDYETYATFDQPEVILAKVVCNLRNYHGLDAKNTVNLITTYFNQQSPDKWSKEAVRLTWEQVERFTPDLGLIDPDAISKQRMKDQENDLVDLIAYTRSGGRVSLPELMKVFRDWFPEHEIYPKVFGKVVKEITGIKARSSNGITYYDGLHLPTAEELKDPNHFIGYRLPEESPWMGRRRQLPAA